MIGYIENGRNYRENIVSEVNPIAVRRTKGIAIRDFSGSIIFEEWKDRLYFTIRVLQDFLASEKISSEDILSWPSEIRSLVKLEKSKLQEMYQESQFCIFDQYKLRPDFVEEDWKDLFMLVSRGHFSVTLDQIQNAINFYNRHVKEKISTLAEVTSTSENLVRRLTERYMHIKHSLSKKSSRNLAIERGGIRMNLECTMLKENRREHTRIKEIIDSSIQVAVDKYNCAAIVLPMNEASYPIYASGGVGKCKDIQLKTEKYGPDAGFILKTGSELPPHGYKFSWSKVKSRSRDVLCDSSERPVTSDLDVLCLAFLQNNSSKIDKMYGWVRPEDKLWIKFINEEFKGNMEKLYDVRPGNLCQHGPFSLLKRLGPKCLKFPMEVYIAGDQKRKIESRTNLAKICQYIRNRGLNLHWPEQWGVI